MQGVSEANCEQYFELYYGKYFEDERYAAISLTYRIAFRDAYKSI